MGEQDGKAEFVAPSKTSGAIATIAAFLTCHSLRGKLLKAQELLRKCECIRKAHLQPIPRYEASVKISFATREPASLQW